MGVSTCDSKVMSMLRQWTTENTKLMFVIRSSSFQIPDNLGNKGRTPSVQATADHHTSLVLTTHHATTARDQNCFRDSTHGTAIQLQRNHGRKGSRKRSRPLVYFIRRGFCMSDYNRSRHAFETSRVSTLSSHCRLRLHNIIQLEGSSSRDPPGCRLMPPFRIPSCLF